MCHYLYFAEAKYRYNSTVRSDLNCYIVHCHGNHFLNPGQLASKSGCHGNILYNIIKTAFHKPCNVCGINESFELQNPHGKL